MKRTTGPDGPFEHENGAMNVSAHIEDKTRRRSIIMIGAKT
jgi:hypothetical protein